MSPDILPEEVARGLIPPVPLMRVTGLHKFRESPVSGAELMQIQITSPLAFCILLWHTHTPSVMKAPWVPFNLLSCLYQMWNSRVQESPGQSCVHQASGWATQLPSLLLLNLSVEHVSCQDYLPLNTSLNRTSFMNSCCPVQLPVVGEGRWMTVSFIHTANIYWAPTCQALFWVLGLQQSTSNMSAPMNL